MVYRYANARNPLAVAWRHRLRSSALDCTYLRDGPMGIQTNRQSCVEDHTRPGTGFLVPPSPPLAGKMGPVQNVHRVGSRACGFSLGFFSQYAGRPCGTDQRVHNICCQGNS
jgi:hypothetical protein